ncbi:MAG: signal peptidase II [Pseudomonadota bacterium]
MTPRLRAFLAFFLIPAVVIVDQWTKYLVLNEPRFNARECLDGMQRCGQIELSQMFDLTMLWNRGMSFGALQSEGIMRWVLVVVTLAIAIGFSIWLVRAGRQITAIALALVVGGAIGNVIDRVRFGAVVDFLDFSGIWRPYFFNYVFNIADAAISVGAVLLFFDQFILSREKQPDAETSQ